MIKINQNLFITIIILLIASIILNLFLFVSFNSKIRKINIEDTLEEIATAINASDNTMELISFYQEQLSKNLINENELSASYQELINMHDQLIVELNKIENKDTNDIKNLTILFINERKKIFENYKQAIDLNSQNYNNVANKLINTANEYKKNIENEIKNIK